MGKVSYEVTDHEKASRVFRRSLFVVKDMKEGETFTQENLRSIRPGYGLPCKYTNDILGRKSTRAIQKGTPLSWEMIR